MNERYEVVIGLEIHMRLDTASKMFCGTPNADATEPNLHTCPICLGHPGTLPQVNEEAIRLARLLSLAVNCEVQETCKFDRKHYFYPDLPKGYQISQFDEPLATHGYLDIESNDGSLQRVRIERLHIEEDAAKLRHARGGHTVVDFNRAGAPLVELVTKPDMHTMEQARLFAQELQQIARYVGASQADMEKGHFRCDANISLRPIGDQALYPKTEIKNMNSFRSIERAIQFEVERQAALWDADNAPELTTTRGWDDKRGITVEQRVKEEAADYRYFPEPDLPPLTITQDELNQLRSSIPELPAARRSRFRQEYGLSYQDALVLTTDPEVSSFFEEVISELRGWLNTQEGMDGTNEERWHEHSGRLARLTCSWVTTELFGLLKESGQSFDAIRVTPENFAELLTLFFTKQVHSSAAHDILKIMLAEGGDPSLIMRDHDLGQLSDANEIQGLVNRIIAENSSVVEDYKQGKEKALMFLIGKVMKETKGKVNPEIAAELLKKSL